MLSESLIGIYLHGSLAMGCFNPLRSDIDLLVALGEPLPVPFAHRVARLLLDLSLHPHPIEISFLTQEQLASWRFPTPYEFHYSEHWRQRLENRLASGGQGLLGDDSPTDPDLAAHFTILRHRGVVLSGPAIKTLFPAVPSKDYLSSIWHFDMSDCADWIVDSPVYGVLNLCRVLAYVTEGLIVSKDEGGRWAIGTLGRADLPLIQQALRLYGSEAPCSAAGHDTASFDPRELTAFAGRMVARIEKASDNLVNEVIEA